MICNTDPHLWSNYPEAQNPKMYLNSFGELPKVILSPNPSVSLDLRSNSTKRSHKYNKKPKNKLPNIKMGITKKTISRTELMADSLDEIRSTSSSSSSSPVNEPVVNHYIVDDSKLNFNNESIITIENFNLSLNDSPSHNSITDQNDVDSNSSKANDSTNNSNNNNTDQEFERMETIDLKQNNLLSADLDNYGNLWKSTQKQDNNI